MFVWGTYKGGALGWGWGAPLGLERRFLLAL